MVRYCIHPRIAIGREQRRQPVPVHPRAGVQPGGELADAKRRERALADGVGRRDDQLRLAIQWLLQPGERGHPFR